MDGQTDTAVHFIMPPTYGGREHNKCLGVTRFEAIHDVAAVLIHLTKGVCSALYKYMR